MRETEPTWIAADEADLRRRLQDLADTRTVDDTAWEKIQERIASATSRTTSPSRRPVALAAAGAAAAAVVLVVGAVTVLEREDGAVVDAIDDDDRTTTTDRSRSTSSTSSTTSDSDSSATTIEPPRGADGVGSLSPTGNDAPGAAPSGPDTGSDRENDTPPGTQPGTGGPGPDPSPTPTIPGTTVPEPPGETRWLASLGPSIVTQGQAVTVNSITPCRHDTYQILVTAWVVYEGANIGWGMPSFVDDPPTMWTWTFQTSTDNPPGVYTVHAQCGAFDPAVPGSEVYWDYEPLTFTVQAAG